MSHLSSLALDSLLEHRLPPDQEAQARRHLEGCERCRAELTFLEEARHKFGGEVFARSLPKVLERGARQSPWGGTTSLFTWLNSRHRALWWAPALAALLLTVGVLAKSHHDSALAIKGGLDLRVFVHRGSEVLGAPSGTRLKVGDQVRFVIEGAHPRYLLLVSVDGAGTDSVYFPFDGTESGELSAEPKVELPDSVVLDASPGPERVFALFSDKPISAKLAKDALRFSAHGGPERIRNTHHLVVAGVRAQATWLMEKQTP